MAIEDIAYIGVYAFGAVVFIVVAMAMIQAVNTAFVPVANNIQAQTGANMTDSKNAMAATERVANNLDYVIPLLVFLGFIVSAGLAYFVPVSPVFLPLSIVMFFFVCGAAYLISQAGITLLDTVEATTGTVLPLTRTIFENWLIISVVEGVLVMVALYAKPQASMLTGR